MKHVIITFMNFPNPANFFENRKEQKDGVKPVIEKMLETFDFYTAEINRKGGLGRDSDRYGDFLRSLDHDKFIMVQQLAGILLEKIEGFNERPPKSGLSESVAETFANLKKTCDVIKTIQWQAYPKPGERLGGYSIEETHTRFPVPTLAPGDNQRMSACLSDIYAPIHKLRTVDFPSLFSSKVDVDFQYQ